MVSRQFLAFLAVSGIAAGANFGSRVAFSLALPYAAAIVAAFCVGLSTAFVLNKLLVFRESTQPVQQQMVWFLAVNLGALVQTLAVSLLLARWLLPLVGITTHADAIAHAIGIAVPAVTSYFAHKRLSFR